jgi:hypothetical protein
MFDMWQRAFAACCFFIMYVCMSPVISGHLTPGELLRVAEYGLATALIALCFGAMCGLAGGSPRFGVARRGVAWLRQRGPRRRHIVTLFAISLDLSHVTHPIRGSAMGTLPAEPLFAVVGLCAALRCTAPMPHGPKGGGSVYHL